MRTLVVISAVVLGTAITVASLGNTPTYGRPQMIAVLGTSSPSPSPSRINTIKSPYGVMEGEAVINLVAAPLHEWNVIELPGAGNSAGYFNAARRDAVGRSTVWFPGLDPTGAVLVTALGPGSAHCKAVDVRPSPESHPGMDVQVACFDPAGNPSDAAYTLSYTRPAARIAGSGGWVRGSEQYNSTGGRNTTTRLAVGSYLVRMAGLGGPGGHAQVTAIGTSSDWCKVSRWYPNGADEMVAVKCFAPGGAPADSTFNLSFARGTDATLTSNRAAAFYTSSADPSTAFVTAGATGAVTVERLTAGRYRVRAPLDITGGAAHVTAQGDGGERCKLLGWNNIDGIQVACSADTAFSVAWSS
ncbi:hypothetical protein [Allorhizocola rhizosphaerae]|uniref:hypothetical protein n=1 Tax=Allorhizocola rhizosphaerae TaxID=1872709 RepID=UPI000E3B83DE|nr:hypothetical protein [Allorhizocola rhizosphaerae]